MLLAVLRYAFFFCCLGTADDMVCFQDVVFLDEGLSTIITAIKVARQIFHRMKGMNLRAPQLSGFLRIPRRQLTSCIALHFACTLRST